MWFLSEESKQRNRDMDKWFNRFFVFLCIMAAISIIATIVAVFYFGERVLDWMATK